MAGEFSLLFNFLLFAFIILITTWNNTIRYDTFADASTEADSKKKKPIEGFEAPVDYNSKSLYEDQVTNLPMKRYGEKARKQELLPEGYDNEHFAGF